MIGVKIFMIFWEKIQDDKNHIFVALKLVLREKSTQLIVPYTFTFVIFVLQQESFDRILLKRFHHHHIAVWIFLYYSSNDSVTTMPDSL